jgi:hypothetical protein
MGCGAGVKLLPPVGSIWFCVDDTGGCVVVVVVEVVGAGLFSPHAAVIAPIATSQVRRHRPESAASTVSNPSSTPAFALRAALFFVVGDAPGSY